MTCLPCGREFHDECPDFSIDISSCCCEPSPVSDISGSIEPSKDPASRRRADDTVSVSAGRKRAAVDYEIDPNAPCEWRGKVNCGGGFIPVPGCLIGFQTDRHHGPDKNTTNNSEENVHLICKPCHNLWHRRNDPEYGGNKLPEGILLHLPRWATEDEASSLITKEVV
jgi:hypothetical protein